MDLQEDIKNMNSVYHRIESADLDASLDLAIINSFGPEISCEEFAKKHYGKYSYMCEHRIPEIITNIICEILDKTKLYKKEDIYKELKKRMFYKFEKYGCSEYNFQRLYDHIWLSKFDNKRSNTLEAPKIFQYALKNQPTIYWIFNSRFFVCVFSVLFLLLEYWIAQSAVGEPFMWKMNWKLFSIKVLVLCAVFSWFLNAKIFKLACFMPLIAVLFYNNFDIFMEFQRHSNSIAIGMSKLNLYILNIKLGLSFLLWFPVILLNKERWQTYADYKHYKRTGHFRNRKQ